MCILACSNESTQPEPVSTVDSNLADPTDTTLPELYLDNPRGDTTFTIALDSAGETILPEDTGYIKQK